MSVDDVNVNVKREDESRFDELVFYSSSWTVASLPSLAGLACF